MQVAAFAADPSGTWTWVQMGGGRGGPGGPGGAPATPPPPQSLVLALKDGKLTGSLTSPGRGGGEPIKTDITDASFKDDVVTFSVVREGFQGNQTTQKFTGKLSGDTITGTRLQTPGRGGAEPMPMEWVAKKS